VTAAQIRAQVAEIIVRAQTRSAHPDRLIAMPEALRIVDALVASDDAPEWDAVKAGVPQMRAVVNMLRAARQAP
jgi:hypothetical protein